MSLRCHPVIFSHRIDKIMPYLDYSENNVITSCIPMVKRAEKKHVSAVTDEAARGEIGTRPHLGFFWSPASARQGYDRVDCRQRGYHTT